MAAHVRALLREIGEDPEREGLLKTPNRVARALRELTRGLPAGRAEDDPDKAVFTERLRRDGDREGHRDVLVSASTTCCRSSASAHVAYLPNGKVVGLCKLPRLVDVFARRLQVQERLTTQIAETLMDALEPERRGRVVEARHLCMMMRGVEKQHSTGHHLVPCSAASARTSPPGPEFLNLVRHDAG